MHISIPKHASDIIKTLSAHGYEAYVVGGCVRDSILGKEPADWDITTSALPEQVKALFPRTIDTGLKHGTVTIMMDKVGYEVTTYRIDGTYEDHRRPNEVTFTSDLKEDLMRRDFTINAMAAALPSGSPHPAREISPFCPLRTAWAALCWSTARSSPATTAAAANSATCALSPAGCRANAAAAAVWRPIAPPHG